ncbi:hypothetical protein [uncultured Thermanaerothrix sp.]|uniref:hypothetical protein n=1 Tax=uncultured Thermanaerothrix sp. TaxID=1195149 RepID=UPI00260B76C6|nr:hypothetical protein [uncultured Thermanaerothrix sp.]
MSDYGREFEQEFFAQTQRVHLEVDLLNEMWTAIQTVCAANGWDEVEGVRFILAAGLAYLEAQQQEGNAPADPPAADAALLQRLLRERVEINARYAVMRFRAYQFLKDAQALALRLNVCQQERDELRRWVTHLQENDSGTGAS